MFTFKKIYIYMYLYYINSILYVFLININK